MKQPRLYKGENLEGTWLVTLKIDGVRALWTKQGVVSRAGKPLYNLPDKEVGTDAEIYTGTWEDTVSRVRTIKGEELDKKFIYSLDPLDNRLLYTTLHSPTEETIAALLEEVVLKGYEGLVLRQEDTWLKVKTIETYDVVVTGMVEGKGKHTGRLGKFITEMGGVGTGFTDKEREDFWLASVIGMTIEVSCMELTPNGLFRHPRFIRLREDK